jgi:hypothetical protein
MSRRPAVITQAEIARAIRAARAAGLTIIRIVARRECVSIETASRDEGDESDSALLNEGKQKSKVVL